MAIHQSVVVLSKDIPADTAIGPFTLISENVSIGKNVSIQSHILIEQGVRIDDDVSVESGACLGRNCVVEAGVFIGKNAIIKDNVTLHLGSHISSGANVTMDVPPYAIIGGSEASIIGYVDASPDRRSDLKETVPVASESSRVRGVKIIDLPNHLDLRGNLTVGEFEKDFPFIPKRYFLVFGVSSERIRGEHAHFHCHQFLICVNGTCSVIADDGYNRQEFFLDRPNRGLYLPPMTWGIQYKFLRDAVLLVFASETYNPADYIRDYSKFRSLIFHTQQG